MDPTQLALMATGFVAIMASMALPRLLRRMQARRTATSPMMPQTPLLGIEDVRNTAARELVVELDELSTRAMARLDSKIRVLNKLIAEADERIARLEREKLLATNTHE